MAQPLLLFQTYYTETRGKFSNCLQARHGAQRKSQANGDAMCSHAFAKGSHGYKLFWALCPGIVLSKLDAFRNVKLALRYL